MTKEELLAGLKPLEWENNGRAFIYADVKPFAWYSININGLSSLGGKGYDVYFTRAVKLHPYQNVNDELLKTCTTIDEAKAAAQEHYNDVIFKLFAFENQHKKELEESFKYTYDNFNLQQANMWYWQHINPYNQSGYIYPIPFPITFTGV